MFRKRSNNTIQHKRHMLKGLQMSNIARLPANTESAQPTLPRGRARKKGGGGGGGGGGASTVSS